MSCLTKAAHYEFARLAFRNGQLKLSASHRRRGETAQENTLIWAEAHDWYENRPSGWFGRTFRWGRAAQERSFVLKSITSRFNFVIATNTHGTDLMVFNSDEFTNKPLHWTDDDGADRDRKYDLWSYNSKYLEYATDRFARGLGPDSDEPQMRDFLQG